MLFFIRKHYNNFDFINDFLDQEFVDKHNLYAVGRRLNFSTNKIQFYIKSRDALEYKQMIIDQLYHPPEVKIDFPKTSENTLYIAHKFEGKPLLRKFINMTMIGTEYLWGGNVKLETSEVDMDNFKDLIKKKKDEALAKTKQTIDLEEVLSELKFNRVLYTMENKKLSREVMGVS